MSDFKLSAMPVQQGLLLASSMQRKPSTSVELIDKRQADMFGKGETMDPNATLAELRRIIERINDLDGEQSEDKDYEVARSAPRAAELFAALDEWIVGGGFLPSEWTR